MILICATDLGPVVKDLTKLLANVASTFLSCSGKNIDIFAQKCDQLLLTVYGPRQAKMCFRACAKCTDSDSSHACAKSHPGICAPLIYCVLSYDSVIGQ